MILSAKRSTRRDGQLATMNIMFIIDGIKNQFD